jgi:hypothetical protein
LRSFKTKLISCFSPVNDEVSAGIREKTRCFCHARHSYSRIDRAAAPNRFVEALADVGHIVEGYLEKDTLDRFARQKPN